MSLWNSSRFLRLIRRFLLIVSLMFWQGGFLFYSTVVVPIGSEVLGSHEAQGWITRSVTNFLNAGGVLALCFWAWDLFSIRVGGRWTRAIRWLNWGALVILQAVLIGLHHILDSFLDPAARQILDLQKFHPLHELYLSLSGVQFLGSLVLLGLAIASWLEEDGHHRDASSAGR